MIICIVGPTGVGKTKLSFRLAKKYKGIVINADASQVYKKMNIGTAKIKESEKEGIDHYLFDIKEVDEDYTVADYQKDLRSIIDNNKEKNIILVGGSGLYISAGLYDYKFDSIDKKDYSKYSNEELYNMCLEIDNNIDIHKNNRRRLEMFLNKNGILNKDAKLLYKDTIFIGLTTDRENLYNIINNRVDEMIKDGLEREVYNLYQEYGNTKSLNTSIGYKELIRYFNKEISLEDAIELIKKNSRHLAKRQYTWFNNKMNIKWFNTDYNNFNNTCNEVVEYIEKNIS
jgi:tRNA dimethylallyltransferase